MWREKRPGASPAQQHKERGRREKGKEILAIKTHFVDICGHEWPQNFNWLIQNIIHSM